MGTAISSHRHCYAPSVEGFGRALAAIGWEHAPNADTATQPFKLRILLGIPIPSAGTMYRRRNRSWNVVSASKISHSLTSSTEKTGRSTSRTAKPASAISTKRGPKPTPPYRSQVRPFPPRKRDKPMAHVDITTLSILNPNEKPKKASVLPRGKGKRWPNRTSLGEERNRGEKGRSRARETVYLTSGLTVALSARGRPSPPDYPLPYGINDLLVPTVLPPY